MCIGNFSQNIIVLSTLKDKKKSKFHLFFLVNSTSQIKITRIKVLYRSKMFIIPILDKRCLSKQD